MVSCGLGLVSVVGIDGLQDRMGRRQRGRSTGVRSHHLRNIDTVLDRVPDAAMITIDIP